LADSVREDETDNGRGDILRLKQLLPKFIDQLFTIILILNVGVDVSDLLLPSCLNLTRLALLYDVLDILLGQRLKNIHKVGILLHLKELLLNVLEHRLTAHLSNQEGLGWTAHLQGTLSSVLVVTNHQILLDHGLDTSIPVSVLGHGLLHQNLALVRLFHGLLLDGLRLGDRGWLRSLWFLTAEVGEEISRSLGVELSQV